MKVFKVTLEDAINKLLHVLAVIANDTQMAIDLARLELGDRDKKYVLYDIQLITTGVIMKYSYY